MKHFFPGAILNFVFSNGLLIASRTRVLRHWQVGLNELQADTDKLFFRLLRNTSLSASLQTYYFFASYKTLGKKVYGLAINWEGKNPTLKIGGTYL